MEAGLNYYINMVCENCHISREKLMEELSNIGSDLSPKEKEVYQTGYVQGLFEGWLYNKESTFPQ